MIIHGADNTFNTLHKHKIYGVHKIHKACHSTAAATTMPCLNTATVAKRCLDPTNINTKYETHKTHCFTTLKSQYSSRSNHCINMAECTKKINQELTLLENPTKHCTISATKHAVKHKAEHAALHTPTGDIISAASKTMNISMIGAALFNHFVQQSQKDLRFQIFSIILQDINIVLALKKHTDLATKLLSKYHDFLDVFSWKDADVLPNHRPGYNYTIELIKSKALTWSLLYSMSAEKLKVLKAYIKKMFDKDFIPASSS